MCILLVMVCIGVSNGGIIGLAGVESVLGIVCCLFLCILVVIRLKMLVTLCVLQLMIFRAIYLM